MDVTALQARLAAFAAERGWDEMHNPRNLAIALAGEAGMLLDLFRWLTDVQAQRIESEYKREAAAEAIADLILHTLRLADKLNIDVESAVARKLAENDANYPVPVAEVAAPVAAAPAAAPASKVPEKMTVAPPIEAKRAVESPAEEKKPLPAPAAPAPLPAPASQAAEPAAEPPKPPADKALPTWLDGILPARSTSARKKPAATPKPAPEPPAAPEPPKAAEPLKAPEPQRPPEPPRAPEAVPAPPVVEEIEVGAPPFAAESEPEPEAPEAPVPERYVHLDTDVAKGFAKSLAKRVDSARSNDPLLRELHDEVETLRRTLYSPLPKRTWMGDSLKTIRAILEEAATHSVAEEIRAHDYIAQIDRMLNA